MRVATGLVLSVLILLPALASAGRPWTFDDDVGDELATLTAPAVIMAPACHDPAIDLTSVSYASDGEVLTVSVTVADLAAQPYCGSALAAPLTRTSLQISYEVHDFDAGRGFIARAVPTASGMRLCTWIGFPFDEGRGLTYDTATCRDQPIEAPLAWTIPLSGAVTWPGNWVRPYDFRDAPLHGSRAFGHSEAEGKLGTRYFLQDHTASFTTHI